MDESAVQGAVAGMADEYGRLRMWDECGMCQMDARRTLGHGEEVEALLALG
jgi:hypothetical protein